MRDWKMTDYLLTLTYYGIIVRILSIGISVVQFPDAMFMHEHGIRKLDNGNSNPLKTVYHFIIILSSSSAAAAAAAAKPF